MEEVLVKCERLDHFGRGIGYVLGKIIFVHNIKRKAGILWKKLKRMLKK